MSKPKEVLPTDRSAKTSTSEEKQTITETEINYLFALAGGLSYSGGTRNSATNSQLKRFVTLLLERKSPSNAPSRHPLTDEEINLLLSSTLKPDSTWILEPGDYSYTQVVQIIRAVEEKHNIKK